MPANPLDRDRDGPREALGSDRFVRALPRGLGVIAAFSAENPAMTVSGVARAAGISRASARRFLLTLQQLGYARIHGDLYSLTPRVLELGGSYLSTLPVVEAVREHLQSLSATLGEPAYASILDDADIVYVAGASDRRSIKVGISVGTRVPACSASMGRVILAGLAESEIEAYLRRGCDRCRAARSRSCDGLQGEIARVRSQGWCVVDREPPFGGRSVAVALGGASGSAIGVATHAELTDIRKKVVPRLREVAREIGSGSGLATAPRSERREHGSERDQDPGEPPEPRPR